ELRVDDVARGPLLLDGLGHQEGAATQDAQADLLHVFECDLMPAPDLEDAVDQAVVVATAGVGLDRYAHQLKLGTETGGRLGRERGVGVSSEQAERPFDGGGWAGKSGRREPRCEDSAVGGPC